MATTRSFRAVIQAEDSGGAYVSIPFDVEQVFGKKKVKVKAVIAGVPYRGSLVRMGGSCHVLGIRKDIRTKAGKGIGDEIDIKLEEDLQVREVEIPGTLAQALGADPVAEATFRQLSYTHQREYVEWIQAAKREATRQSRAADMLVYLRQGKKSPRKSD